MIAIKVIFCRGKLITNYQRVFRLIDYSYWIDYMCRSKKIPKGGGVDG